ncbi:MAG: hypothetical protein RLZ60_1528 [Pseudomonadota bacterium]
MDCNGPMRGIGRQVACFDHGIASLVQRQTNAFVPFGRISQRRTNLRFIKGIAQRLSTPFQPCKVETKVADTISPAPHRFDQEEVFGSICAKRAFHKASSYSDAGVESQTIPPPTFNVA